MLVSDVFYQDGSYLRQNPSWHEEHSPWKAIQALKILRQCGINPQTLAEVGCGAGAILEHIALEMPTATITGYDISPDAIALCRKRRASNLDYRLKNILESDDYYDAILCFDVFEHVEDYLGFLKSLRSHARWHVFHIPLDLNVLSIIRASTIKRWRRKLGHLHYFTKDTALASLEYAGYHVQSWSYTRGAIEVPGQSLLRRIAVLPRRVAMAFDEDLAVRLLGGCSLIVLCDTNADRPGADRPGNVPATSRDGFTGHR
jgi:hypothetical protein